MRAEVDVIKKNKALETNKKKEKKPAVVKEAPIVPYQPYKCGLCDLATETIEAVREHCASVHEISLQFKCSLCDVASDNKAEVEVHSEASHALTIMMRIFYVDPTSNAPIDPFLEEKREPLWRRDMPGLKHIRGILYEEYPVETFDYGRPNASSSMEKLTTKTGRSMDEVDNFPMTCKECDLQKKTIKGLKMHIKLLHLRTGKFLCRRCQFSANMLNSIHTHYKIKHPEAADAPDFEERSDDKMIFSHDFWKSNWGIPTLAERKEVVQNRHDHDAEILEHAPIVLSKKRKAMGGGRKGYLKKAKKRGAKRKLASVSNDTDAAATADDAILSAAKIQELEAAIVPAALPILENPPPNVMEISPFEAVPTYKCQYCSKRSNTLERIERHLKAEHTSRSEDELGYKVLTRDQVVDILTLTLVTNNSNCNSDFICFYCEDVVGTIYDLKSHFAAEHKATDTFRVKRVQDGGNKKPINGYLECQVCGYLTPGFDRSKQRVHFHDEHPMEPSINASKYVSKVKLPSTAAAPVATNVVVEGKFDPAKYFGLIMNCPKEDCNFDNSSNAAMNAHLRKHTQTYKCGHCGKTHPNSSEFHRHSAMIHGDK